MNTRALKSGTIQYKDTVGNSRIYDLVDGAPSLFHKRYFVYFSRGLG